MITLGVAIDPSAAVKGAAEFDAATERMSRSTATYMGRLEALRQREAAIFQQKSVQDATMSKDTIRRQQETARAIELANEHIARSKAKSALASDRAARSEAQASLRSQRAMQQTALATTRLGSALNFLPYRYTRIATTAAMAARGMQSTTIAANTATGAMTRFWLALTGPFLPLVIAALLALAAAIIAVKTAISLLKAGLEAAAIERHLTHITRSAGEARTALIGINAVANKWKFPQGDVVKAYESLYRFRAAGEDVGKTLRLLATLALGSKEGFTSMASAVQAVGEKGRVTTETISAFNRANVDIITAMARVEGRTTQQIFDAIRKRKVGYDQLTAAMREAGKTAALMEREMQNNLGSQISQVASKYKTLYAEIGRPFAQLIDKALTPFFSYLSRSLDAAIPLVSKWAQTMADSVAIMFGAFRDGKVIEIMSLAFEITAMNMKDYFTENFSKAIEEMKSLAKSFLDGFWAQLKNPLSIFGGGQDGVAVPTGETKAEKEARLLRLIAPYTAERGLPAGGAGVGGFPQDRNAGAGTAGRQRELETDLRIMRQYYETAARLLDAFNQKKLTQIEYDRRLEELRDKTAKQLADPTKYAAALEAWRVYNEERRKIMEEADRKILNGQATMLEAIQNGLRKASDQIGTWQQGVEDLTTRAVLNIGGGFADAFSSFIDGSKSASEAFSQFAVSMLKDISRMIIQLLVMQAIQSALGFFGIGSGAAFGTTTATALRAPLAALGGPINGPSHASGGVKLEAEGGEYIINRNTTSQLGSTKLALLNANRAEIVPKFYEGGVTGGFQRTGRYYGDEPTGDMMPGDLLLPGNVGNHSFPTPPPLSHSSGEAVVSTPTSRRYNTRFIADPSNYYSPQANIGGTYIQNWMGLPSPYGWSSRPLNPGLTGTVSVPGSDANWVWNSAAQYYERWNELAQEFDVAQGPAPNYTLSGAAGLMPGRGSGWGQNATWTGGSSGGVRLDATGNTINPTGLYALGYTQQQIDAIMAAHWASRAAQGFIFNAGVGSLPRTGTGHNYGTPLPTYLQQGLGWNPGNDAQSRQYGLHNPQSQDFRGYISPDDQDRGVRLPYAYDGSRPGASGGMVPFLGRLHSGTGGLGAEEYHAILQRGEQVTPSRTAQTTASRVVNINVVVNNTGGRGEAKGTADTTDRDVLAAVKQMEVIAQQMIDKNMRNFGSLQGVGR